jgi:hypothetical protein
MNAEVLSLVLAVSIALITCALLSEAWRALHRARRLKYRYALYAHRDHLIRLGASGTIDPESAAFQKTLAGVNVLLNLNDQIGLEFFRLAEDLASEERHAELAQKSRSELRELPEDQREALEAMQMLIGRATVDLLCHNSRIVRALVWVRRQDLASTNNTNHNGSSPRMSLEIDHLVQAARTPIVAAYAA